jgi:hypothetical protein
MMGASVVAFKKNVIDDKVIPEARSEFIDSVPHSYHIVYSLLDSRTDIVWNTRILTMNDKKKSIEIIEGSSDIDTSIHTSNNESSPAYKRKGDHAMNVDDIKSKSSRVELKSCSGINDEGRGELPWFKFSGPQHDPDHRIIEIDTESENDEANTTHNLDTSDGDVYVRDRLWVNGFLTSFDRVRIYLSRLS